MPSFLWRWLLTSLTILMTPYLVTGIEVRDFGAALAAAAILGVLNLLVKPVLILLTLPLTLISLGFFLLMINAFLFYMVGSLVEGVAVASFGSAFLGSLLITIVSWATQLSFDRKGGRRVVVVRQFRAGGGTSAKPPRSRDVTPL